MNAYDIDHIRLETLLFQTGYLTIKHEETLFTETVFLLNYPNREVRSTFNQVILDRYLTDQPQERLPVMRALLANDFDTLHQRFVALFDSIANDNYRKNNIAEYEGYYAAVMYAYLCSLGIDTIAEDTSNRGRIDLTLRFKLPDGQRQAYIFEFKAINNEEGDGSALQQLRDKGYASKYDDGACRVFLIGMEFSRVTRNIVGLIGNKLHKLRLPWQLIASGNATDAPHHHYQSIQKQTSPYKTPSLITSQCSQHSLLLSEATRISANPFSAVLRYHAKITMPLRRPANEQKSNHEEKATHRHPDLP